MKQTTRETIESLKLKIKEKRSLIVSKNNKLIKNLKNKVDLEKLKSFVRSQIKDKNKLESFYPSIFIQKLQDRLEQLARNENNQVVLKQSQFWAGAITWVLMGSTAFAVGWISIAETDEVVIATGKLIPKSGVVDVQMPLEGIAREILVNEGDYVKKGDILILLDTEITNAKDNALRKSLELNKGIKDKLQNLLKEGAVSELQYIQQIEKVEEIESKIKLNNVQLKYQEIVSPLDGRVFDLQPKGPGFVAKTSQPVLQIVPNDNLIAKVEIDSRSIGFVRTGKKAEISIDSFPASDFGVIEGEVTSIGSDALEPVPAQGKGYRFPAKISLKNQFLELKSGKKLPLQSGMSLNANIKLRKVTYLQLLLNNFIDKADSLKSI